MLNKLQHTLLLAAGKSVLSNNNDLKLSTGKRMVSILAGAFILRRGLKNIGKSPIIALQEVAIGSLLLYNGATGNSKLNSSASHFLNKKPYLSITGRQPKPQLARLK